jgi:hypothetical protein
MIVDLPDKFFIGIWICSTNKRQYLIQGIIGFPRIKD